MFTCFGHGHTAPHCRNTAMALDRGHFVGHSCTLDIIVLCARQRLLYAMLAVLCCMYHVEVIVCMCGSRLLIFIALHCFGLREHGRRYSAAGAYSSRLLTRAQSIISL